ncbi:MAG: orotate phosphoribosyltransferase [Bernardetiaceae bacterium]|nr:orotate phosphoribosyltransferase [Bernardetiaceae bacterium]
MLLEIGAVKIKIDTPYQWASGWLSPIYCDNRLSLSYPEVRSYIKHAFVKFIQQYYPDVQAIAGVATAGIPQAALIADALSLPMLYVRAKPKGHGTQSQIEGQVAKGASVLLIEDLVSTGMSSLKAVEVLRKEGIKVSGLAAIFSYGFDLASANFEQAQVPFHTLCDYDTMINKAISQGKIQAEALELLQNWRKAPAAWKPKA